MTDRPTLVTEGLETIAAVHGEKARQDVETLLDEGPEEFYYGEDAVAVEIPQDFQNTGMDELAKLKRRADAPRYGSDDIKQIRERAGLTQNQLADWVSVAVSTVEMWEMGGFEPGPDNRVRLQAIDQAQVRGVQPIKDIDAVIRCPGCRSNPAPVVLLHNRWECHFCGESVEPGGDFDK